jgi:hypothetical protein
MPYRGNIPNRRPNQMGDLYAQAGYTATWRRFASAVTGNVDAGMGETLYYTETTITALLGMNQTPGIRETQQAVGLTVAADIYAVTREPLGRRDELVWRGSTYRIESDPVPGVMAGGWVTHLKRGE